MPGEPDHDGPAQRGGACSCTRPRAGFVEPGSARGYFFFFAAAGAAAAAASLNTFSLLAA